MFFPDLVIAIAALPSVGHLQVQHLLAWSGNSKIK